MPEGKFGCDEQHGEDDKNGRILHWSEEFRVNSEDLAFACGFLERSRVDLLRSYPLRLIDAV